MLRFAALALPLLCLAGASGAALRGQTPPPAGTPRAAAAPSSAEDAVAGRHLLLIEAPDVDLGEYRQAILDRRDAADVAAIVADLDGRMAAHAARLDRAAALLGSRVTDHWWLVPCVAVSGTAPAAALERLGGVVAVHPDRIVGLHLSVATDGTHHRADQAHQRQTAAGAAIDGAGVTVAVLDTGIDADIGGAGRPHAAFYPSGDATKRTGSGIAGSRIRQAIGTSKLGGEDRNFHGTFVSSIVAGARWRSGSRVDDGFAPGAWLFSMKVTDDRGSATYTWLLNAWQKLAVERPLYNIAAANNSLSGSPALNDPVQLAIDSLAFHADIVVTLSAGNRGADTSQSQGAWNAVAVGALEKSTLDRAAFSAVGPLHGTQRTYPDLVAVGKDVEAVLRDDEANLTRSSGTSFSAPMVAGTVALVQQAAPGTTAVETKALLLNTARPAAGHDRNQHGLGILDCDAAVARAARGDVQKLRMLNPTRLRRVPVPAVAGRDHAVTVTWMRRFAGGKAQPADDLDLRILDPTGQQVAIDGNRHNAYEQVRFRPRTTGVHQAEVRWVNAVSGPVAVDFAIAGAGPACTAPPVLTTIQPARITSVDRAPIELAGRDLGGVYRLTAGGVEIVDFDRPGPGRLRFVLPAGVPLGKQPVAAWSACGASNGLTLEVVAPHPAVLTGTTAVQRGRVARYDLATEAGWTSALLVSTSPLPSHIPGIVDLRIGNAFKELWPLAILGHDAAGRAGTDLRVPAAMLPAGLLFQAVVWDPRAPRFPVESSNFVATFVY